MVLESLYDGTWASGALPDEIIVADVLLETGWTWRDWEDTPAWIRQTITDTIMCRREAANRENDRQHAEVRSARG